MKLTGPGKLVLTLLVAGGLSYGAYYGVKHKKVPTAPAAVEQTTAPALTPPAAVTQPEPKVVQNEEVVAAPVKKAHAPKKTVKVSRKSSGGHSTTGSSTEHVDESTKALEKLANGGL